MNRQKLERHTALAARIHLRHNPIYRVQDVNRQQAFPANSRADARDIKRQITSEGGTAYIEQRTEGGHYVKIS